MNVSELRSVTIKAKQEGVAETSSALKALGGAYSEVGAQANIASVSVEKAGKRTLSARDAYDRQTRMVDAAAKSYYLFEKQQRLVDQALNQGIITAGAHATRMELLQQKYGQTAQATGVLARATQGMSAAFEGATGVIAGLAAGIGIGALAGLAKSVFSVANALSEQAEQAGVSVEAFQAYRAVMLTSGIATEQADMIMTRLTRSIGEAQAGGGKALQAFVALGIGMDTLKSGAENTLPAVARGLLAIEDASQRAKLEVDLFGKQGQRLESALRALVDPSTTLIEKQKALGQVMGKDLTDAADNAADRLTEAWNRAKVGMAPGVTWLAEKLSQLVELNARVQNFVNNSSLSAPGLGLMGYGSKAEYDAAQKPQQPAGIPSLDSGLLINGKQAGYPTENYDKAIAKLREEADLTGKSAAQRASIVALRELEAAQIKDGNGALSAQQKIEISQLASTNANYESGKKAQEAQQRAAQKQMDDLQRFDGWVDKLSYEGDQARKKQGDDAAKAASKLKLEQDNYMQDLQDEVKLAGMSADEGERYAAVLRGQRQYHIEIGSAQSDEIYRMVETRQQAEKMQEVVAGISTPLEELPLDFLADKSFEIEASLQEIFA